jgi:hypothetical protein
MITVSCSVVGMFYLKFPAKILAEILFMQPLFFCCSLTVLAIIFILLGHHKFADFMEMEYLEYSRWINKITSCELFVIGITQGAARIVVCPVSTVILSVKRICNKIKTVISVVICILFECEFTSLDVAVWLVRVIQSYCHTHCTVLLCMLRCASDK